MFFKFQNISIKIGHEAFYFANLIQDSNTDVTKGTDLKFPDLEPYSQPSQASKIELFAKKVRAFFLLICPLQSDT